MRAADGSLPRTAGAVMLGLTMVTATVNGCVEIEKPHGSGGAGGTGGTGGVMEGSTVISAYGIASTSSAPQGGMGGMGGMGPCDQVCAEAIVNGNPVCESASANSQKLYNDLQACMCERGAADPMPGCKDVCGDNFCMGADTSGDCAKCVQTSNCMAEFGACAGDL